MLLRNEGNVEMLSKSKGALVVKSTATPFKFAVHNRVIFLSYPSRALNRRAGTTLANLDDIAMQNLLESLLHCFQLSGYF